METTNKAMSANWRTNLGGAISVTGTALIGVGVLAQLTQLSPASATILSDHQVVVLWYVALAGFILSAVGKGVAFLFSADAATVQALSAQLQANMTSSQANGNGVPAATPEPQPEKPQV